MSLSDPNSDSDGSTDSQSEIDEADRAQQEENKKPVSAASYQSSSPTKKDRVRCFSIDRYSSLFWVMETSLELELILFSCEHFHNISSLNSIYPFDIQFETLTCHILFITYLVLGKRSGCLWH